MTLSNFGMSTRRLCTGLALSLSLSVPAFAQMAETPVQSLKNRLESTTVTTASEKDIQAFINILEMDRGSSKNLKYKSPKRVEDGLMVEKFRMKKGIFGDLEAERVYILGLSYENGIYA